MSEVHQSINVDDDVQFNVRLKQGEKDLIAQAAEIIAGGNITKLTRMVLVAESKRIVENGGIIEEAINDDITDTITRRKDHARWAKNLYSSILKLQSLADEIRKAD